MSPKKKHEKTSKKPLKPLNLSVFVGHENPYVLGKFLVAFHGLLMALEML